MTMTNNNTRREEGCLIASMKWSSGLSRDIAVQRQQQHVLVMRKKLEQNEDPNEFLEYEEVKSTTCVTFYKFILITDSRIVF